jgi:hypothetical protein
MQTADPNDDEGGPEMLKMRPRDFGQPIGKGRPFRQPHQVVLQLTLYSFLSLYSRSSRKRNERPSDRDHQTWKGPRD